MPATPPAAATTPPDTELVTADQARLAHQLANESAAEFLASLPLPDDLPDAPPVVILGGVQPDALDGEHLVAYKRAVGIVLACQRVVDRWHAANPDLTDAERDQVPTVAAPDDVHAPVPAPAADPTPPGHLTALDPDGHPCDVLPSWDRKGSVLVGRVPRTDSPDPAPPGIVNLDQYVVTGGHPETIAKARTWAGERLRDLEARHRRGHASALSLDRARAFVDRLDAVTSAR